MKNKISISAQILASSRSVTVLVAVVFAILNPAQAQFSIIHNFAGSTTDGAQPKGSLILNGTTLYGMTSQGGASSNGIVFRMNTDGTGYTNLHNFAGGNFDGSNPNGSITLSGTTLYGMTFNGGAFGKGVVFSINTDGTSYTNLHSFVGFSGNTTCGFSDGSHPKGSLVLNGTTLYGMTYEGGSLSGIGYTGNGIMFRINTDGSGYTNLYGFGGIYGYGGGGPIGSPILVKNLLYGMTYQGGASNNGEVFCVGANGTACGNIFTNLHSFAGGNDGANPFGSLTMGGNILYGMTYQGGNVANFFTNKGVIFKINTDGTGCTNLHVFTGVTSDGANPLDSLLLCDTKLFGMVNGGGNSFHGAIFQINTDGTGYTNLHSFAANSTQDGNSPSGSLILSGGVLYGMTPYGGGTFHGCCFKFQLPPPTVAITTPTNNQRMTNALADVIGTANDYLKVASVWCQVNSNTWNLASTANSFTNWITTLALIAGTNTIRAYAVGLGGNYSLTNTLSIISSNTFNLQLNFTNSQPLKTNGLTFSLQLSKGLNGHIQVSTNLINWVTLTNFVGTNSPITFRDSAAINFPRRFYRAVIP